MEIGYIISSHARYAIPLGKLLMSMAYIGYGKPFIYMVIADSEYDQRMVFENTIIRHVTHNSFDYTGLIEFVQERPYFPDHIFTLQDTMEFSDATHDLIMDGIDPDAYATAVYGGQCNLVAYRYDYLLARDDFILAQRNHSKQESILHEGALWKTAPDNKRGHYNNSHLYVKPDYEYPYGTDVPRLVEYYTAIQLIKYKANHGQNMHNLIVEP